MEDIKDRLGDYKYNFFTNLQNYIDTEFIFTEALNELIFLETRVI